MGDPVISLALRFHVNFYHSYRGDSLDERGIGKDIRVITSILDDLDGLNADGIPVRGTWDIENYYSLEYMMPLRAPELIERIGKRHADGLDEIEAMSWNNGIVSASTGREFEEQMKLMRSNPGGSGLDELFPGWAPILRPQECMYTPSFLRLYPAAGIDALSIYYSAVPFNGFSNFVAPLPFSDSYNPVTLRSRSSEGSMTLIPAYNHGDIAENGLSLRRWLKSLRRRQLAMEDPRDLLLLLDMDADDEFWTGMEIPLLTRFVPSFDGLRRLIESTADLEFLRFVRPADYLTEHPPLGEVYLDQDTADGSFDGLSSWAEKHENSRLWSMIQRGRDLQEYALRLADGVPDPTAALIAERVGASLRAGLMAQSTTHFGMASPVMNRDRLEEGLARAQGSVAAGEEALRLALASAPAATDQGLLFPDQLEAGEAAGYIKTGDEFAYIRLEPGSCLSPGPASPPTGQPPSPEDLPWSVLPPAVRYRGLLRRGEIGAIEEERLPDGGRRLRRTGALSLPGNLRPGTWSQTMTFLPGSPGLYLDVEIEYPLTADKGYYRGRAGRLNRTWDHRWKEVRPAEILPRFDAAGDDPFRIVKHNFFGDVSSYKLDYHNWSPNRRLASFNNHITNSWVAVSNGTLGIAVAQYTGSTSNFAFCPMRSELRRDRQRIALNPFGTYYGPQLRYATAVTGIGRLTALLTADQLASYAPSFNGASSRFSLALFPFDGEAPSAALAAGCMLFSAAPLDLARNQYKEKTP